MAGPKVQQFIRAAEMRAALRQFLRESEDVAGRHGLTPQRYLLLLMIKGAADASESSTVTELTARLQLEQNTVTELVMRAEGAGLLRREASPTDGRVAVLKLTAKGNRLIDAAFAELAYERRALRALVANLG